MILKRLFKKKPQTPIEILQPLADAFFQKKYQLCVEKAEPLFTHKNEEVSWNAKRYAGLAHYKRRHYQEAVDLFKEIAEYSNNTDDWFNLITASVRNKDIELGEKAYDKFNHPDSVKGQNRMLTFPNVTYQMMIALQDVGEYTKALEKLIVLKRYVCQVKQHDADFLAQHGIPFIYQTLVSAKKTLKKVYSEEQIRHFLDDFALHVDASGKESIEEFRERLKL